MSNESPSQMTAAPVGFLVYHTVRREDRKCEYGYTHGVEIYESAMIYPTDRTWLCDNGYTKPEQEPVYEDAEGREYRAKPPIDYYGGTAYLRPEDGTPAFTFWHRRPPALGVPSE